MYIVMTIFCTFYNLLTHHKKHFYRVEMMAYVFIRALQGGDMPLRVSLLMTPCSGAKISGAR